MPVWPPGDAGARRCRGGPSPCHRAASLCGVGRGDVSHAVPGAGTGMNLRGSARNTTGAAQGVTQWRWGRLRLYGMDTIRGPRIPGSRWARSLAAEAMSDSSHTRAGRGGHVLADQSPLAGESRERDPSLGLLEAGECRPSGSRTSSLFLSGAGAGRLPRTDDIEKQRLSYERWTNTRRVRPRLTWLPNSDLVRRGRRNSTGGSLSDRLLRGW